jgi:YHS domain-containing protein
MKTTSNIILTALVAAFTFASAAALRAHDGHDHDKPYTPVTCVVSGDKLGEMGKPVVFEYKGQEIKLCCKACRKDFDKDPAKYLKKLAGK